jgi:hypothetical protein
MGLLSRFAATETWEETRARMIAETNAWLTEGLEHPELAVRIPIIPVESGRRFPPALSRAFWAPLLSE